MATAINIAPQNLFYRVKHPEFKNDIAYKAFAYIDYGESAWAQLLFINERGMTYSVKVHRCDCVNAHHEYLAGVIGLACSPDAPMGANNVTHAEITYEPLIKRPFPKPLKKNPDLEDD